MSTKYRAVHPSNPFMRSSTVASAWNRIDPRRSAEIRNHATEADHEEQTQALCKIHELQPVYVNGLPGRTPSSIFHGNGKNSAFETTLGEVERETMASRSKLVQVLQRSKIPIYFFPD